MAITSFTGGTGGGWRVTRMAAVAGPGLDPVERVTVSEGDEPPGTWRLRGVGSNHRYATRTELAGLAARQPPLGRTEATCAALIPIRKSEAWWRLAQDERRGLFEAHSPHGAGHNGIGMDYLPGVARRLLHSRDLGGGSEPFDFLTWFEFAPAEAPAFDALLRRLRGTAEWGFVEREVEIRLERLDP